MGTAGGTSVSTDCFEQTRVQFAYFCLGMEGVKLKIHTLVCNEWNYTVNLLGYLLLTVS